jgi:rhodanese-related sulfurtransferase
VRPVQEYRAAHLAGAVSIPIRELERRLAELPRHREVVAYCRGPYCVYADEAVRVLRTNGFRARRIDEGVADLRRAGFVIERGEPAARRASRRPRKHGRAAA